MIQNRGCRNRKSPQDFDHTLVLFGHGNRVFPDVGAFAQLFPPLVGQVILFAGRRIGRQNAFSGIPADGEGHRREDCRKPEKGGNIGNQAFAQRQVVPAAVYLTHLYPHPQTVSI